MPTTLLNLPDEILSQILTKLAYTDVANIRETCRQVYDFASPENQLLWQAVFLTNFDDPRDRWKTESKTLRAQHTGRELDWHWYTELRKRIVVLKFIDDEHEYTTTPAKAQSAGENEDFICALLDIVDTAKVCPTPEETNAGIRHTVDNRDISLNIKLLPTNYAFTKPMDTLIRGIAHGVPGYTTQSCSSSHADGAPTSSPAPGSWDTSGKRPYTRSQAARELDKLVRSEAASRLHVLAGLGYMEERDEKAIGRARRIVYDWNLTTLKNEYGPWKVDGSGVTDWRRLEAIFVVVARQFASAVRGRLTLPQGFCFSLPYRTLSDPTTPEDWARVQGGWCGTYVFLHWENLVEFNALQHASHPLAERPTLENGPEACGGLMKLDLHLDFSIKNDIKLQTKLPVCDDLPPLYFSGFSKSYDFHMATGVRGMCCLAPGGREVRWRYIIHYSGIDQWQLEGVQPGGIRSGCVYGTWTSIQHEDGGPVGPFLYTPEELCKPTSVVPVSQAG